MAPPTVLIIGCGIAGPILALLLKRKGYKPIIFERVRELGDAGASLTIYPNGNKVFGFLDMDKDLRRLSIPLEACEDRTAAGEVLGQSVLFSTFGRKYGHQAIGVRRTALNLLLRDKAIAKGIDVREGWALERIDEADESVTAHFTNGKSITGSFLCGCDGIKSATRSLLLNQFSSKEPQPIYTGLSQTAGISPTPQTWNSPRLRNWFGNALHVIAYPVSSTHTTWAITRPETEQTKETWRLYNDSEMKAMKKELTKLLVDFYNPVLELVGNVQRLTKFGLYDREQLVAKKWYSKRCVLVGDAAHPTSPHLGQGANQALEDCWHLFDLLPTMVGIDDDDDDEKLGHIVSVFKQFAELRQPRTTALVKGARARGEMRVKGGLDVDSRNMAIRAAWEDEKALEDGYDALFRGHPFETEAERGI